MKETVKQILLEVKPDIEAKLDESNLVTEGILDSLDIMNLIMYLEGKFDIEIDPEDVMSENFESVDTIITLIEKCKG